MKFKIVIALAIVAGIVTGTLLRDALGLPTASDPAADAVTRTAPGDALSETWSRLGQPRKAVF